MKIITTVISPLILSFAIANSALAAIVPVTAELTDYESIPNLPGLYITGSATGTLDSDTKLLVLHYETEVEAPYTGVTGIIHADLEAMTAEYQSCTTDAACAAVELFIPYDSVTWLGDSSTGNGVLILGGINSRTGIESISHWTVTAVPLPAAAWLFGSALIGVVGMARRNRDRSII